MYGPGTDRTTRGVGMVGYDQRIEVRCDKEMKRYLEDLDIDSSKYVRDLITKDRIEKGDPNVVDPKIEWHKKEIKKLEDIKKTKVAFEKEAHEFLEYHSKNYKINATHRTEVQRIKFIEKAIMPTLKKYGYNRTPEEIDDLLLNWGKMKNERKNWFVSI